MTTLRTSIDVTAQRGSAAAPDSPQYAQLLVIQPGTSVDEAIPLRAYQVGHFHGRPVHGLRNLRERGTGAELEVRI